MRPASLRMGLGDSRCTLGSKCTPMPPWPTFDPALVTDDQIEVPVQINGKVAGRVSVAKDASQEAIEAAALADAKIAARLAGMTIVKRIYVPGRMLNIVVKK